MNKIYRDKYVLASGLILTLLVLSGLSACRQPAKTVINSVDMEFALIPSGAFSMGSGGGEYDEQPPRRVVISKAFYLGKYPVTQAQWMAVMRDNPSYFKGDDYPVDSVSWNDAQEFIRRLNRKEHTALYRLPTEAEWEYAARAGSITDYFFGNDQSKLDEYCWYSQNVKQPEPTGTRKPNPWGLYDMCGAVWEWVQDWYEDSYYSHAPAADPQGPSEGINRVLRGGSRFSNAFLCRSSARHNQYQEYRANNIGLRLVLDLE